MRAAEITRGVKKGGKRIEKKVVRGLVSLVLYGRVSTVGADQFVVCRLAYSLAMSLGVW